jgi:hypothetical protein
MTRTLMPPTPRKAHGRTFEHDRPGLWTTSSGPWCWRLTRRTNDGRPDAFDAHGEDAGWWVSGPGQLARATHMGDHCTDFESAMRHCATIALAFLAARAEQAPDRCSCDAPEACVAPCPLDTDSGESASAPPAGNCPPPRTVDGGGREAEPGADCNGFDPGPAEPVADTFFGASGRLGDAIQTAVAAALVPGARHAIEAKLAEERAAIELAAVAGMATDTAIAEARRRFAACSPSMTLTGAMHSVARDLMHGDWTPTA